MNAQNLKKPQIETPTKPDIATNPDASRGHVTAEQIDQCSTLAMVKFHQARYLDPNVSRSDRNESARWLIDRGHIGVNGRMLVVREVAR